MANDGIIVLSHHVIEDGQMSQQTAARMRKGIELMINDHIGLMAVTGGAATKGIPLVHAEVMRDYALREGIDRKRIVVEGASMDTVGQAVFTRGIVERVYGQNWKDIAVITSDYHVERVKTIFDFVYGDGYSIGVLGVSSELGGDTQTKINEGRSIEAFKRTFEGVSPGNFDNILNTLKTKHPLYRYLEKK